MRGVASTMERSLKAGLHAGGRQDDGTQPEGLHAGELIPLVAWTMGVLWGYTARCMNELWRIEGI
jgi:hypothetical protein